MQTLSGSFCLTPNLCLMMLSPLFAVECPTLDSPASGAMTLNTDGTTSTAMFTCFVGYHLKGMETLTCDSSGVWTDFEPVCSKLQLCYAAFTFYFIGSHNLGGLN